MNELIGDMDKTKIDEKVTEKTVVISRGITDNRPPISEFEQSLQDLVVDGSPVPRLAKPPTIDDVADEIEILGLVSLEKCEERFGL